MKVRELDIPGVLLIEPAVFGDARGFFLETWRNDVFRSRVCDVEFIQDNLSRSRQGTVRGMHYQLQHTQGKLVRCAAGRIWDVIVDMRRSSPTFGRWLGAELSDENQQQLWIPPGLAHGFLVLSGSADVSYKVTDDYHPQSERTVLWNDPAIGIRWPIPAGVTPLLSEKDICGIPLAASDHLP